MNRIHALLAAAAITAGAIAYNLSQEPAPKTTMIVSAQERETLRDAPGEPAPAPLDNSAVDGAKEQTKEARESARLDEVAAQAAIKMKFNGIDVVGTKTTTVDLAGTCHLFGGCYHETLVVFTREKKPLRDSHGNGGINPTLSVSDSDMAVVQDDNGKMSVTIVDRAKLLEPAQRDDGYQPVGSPPVP